MGAAEFRFALFHWFHDDCQHNVPKPQLCWSGFCFAFSEAWLAWNGICGQRRGAGHGEGSRWTRRWWGCHLRHMGILRRCSFRLTFHLLNNVSLTICSSVLFQISTRQMHLVRLVSPNQGCASIKWIFRSARMWPLITNLPSILDSHMLFQPWPFRRSIAIPYPLTSPSEPPPPPSSSKRWIDEQGNH